MAPERMEMIIGEIPFIDLTSFMEASNWTKVFLFNHLAESLECLYSLKVLGSAGSDSSLLAEDGGMVGRPIP